MFDSKKNRDQVKGFVGWVGGRMVITNFPGVPAEDQQIPAEDQQIPAEDQQI